MSDDFNYGLRRDLPPITDNMDEGLITDVPQHMESLPDGQEVLVVGDVEHCKDFCHRQGDNDLGYRGTCGLCSSQDVLNQFGVDVSENDVVRYAAEHGLCVNDAPDPAMNGGTLEWQQAKLLTDYGVPAHVETGDTLDELADHVEEGRGVIIEVNAGVLWNDSRYLDWGQSNHAVVVTGVAHDPGTGDVVGYYINDSGAGQAGRYVDAQTMNAMWLQTGGSCVLTDVLK